MKFVLEVLRIAQLLRAKLIVAMQYTNFDDYFDYVLNQFLRPRLVPCMHLAQLVQIIQQRGRCAVYKGFRNVFRRHA